MHTTHSKNFLFSFENHHHRHHRRSHFIHTNTQKQRSMQRRDDYMLPTWKSHTVELFHCCSSNEGHYEMGTNRNNIRLRCAPLLTPLQNVFFWAFLTNKKFQLINENFLVKKSVCFAIFVHNFFLKNNDFKILIHIFYFIFCHFFQKNISSFYRFHVLLVDLVLYCVWSHRFVSLLLKPNSHLS